MSKLTPFFFEAKPFRVLDLDGAPWFVAKDVMMALEYADEYNPARAVAHVPDEWKGVHSMHTPGGQQELWCLSEPGLWFFINRSDKPKALPFQKWVAGEVLPSIRQTGSYGMPPVQVPAPAPETVRLTKDEYIDLLKTQVAHLQTTLVPKRGRRDLSLAEKSRIDRLYAQGFKSTAIGRQLGRPAGTVRTYLRQAHPAPES